MAFLESKEKTMIPNLGAMFTVAGEIDQVICYNVENKFDFEWILKLFFYLFQVREDAAREGCIYMPQEASPTNLKPQTTPMCKFLFILADGLIWEM